MADKNRPQMVTCPICGYTDSSLDAEALNMELQQHMRSAHNLDPSSGIKTGTVKPTNEAVARVDDRPAAAPVANVGTYANAPAATPGEEATEDDR